MSECVSDTISVELDTYFVLDGRENLCGVLRGVRPCNAVSLVLKRKADGATFWRDTVMSESSSLAGCEFAIPVGGLEGGYYELLVESGTETVSVIVALRGSVAGDRHTPVDYLAFAKKAVDAIVHHHSRPFREVPDGTPFVTVTRPVTRGYRSLGYKENGVYRTYWFPERPFEFDTFRADHEMWPILDMLSDATGDPEYRESVDGMLGVIAEHGFDPRSGLMILSQECDFDVRTGSAHSKGASDVPKFKPLNSGNCPELHLSRMWPCMSAQLQRCFRSMFHGLITDPQNFDYNRFCGYDFDDRAGQHSLVKTPSHCAFDTAAGRMIHWWSSCWRHTGDEDCLRWARRMTDKWEAVQHPESGLIPNFFGAAAYAPGEDQQPGEWVETRGAALTAACLMQAVAELRHRETAAAFVAQLERMASRLALGVARHAYDARRRIFLEHLELDGTPWQGTARYCFATEAEKHEAISRAPEMAQVQVYVGAGLYRNPNYYEHCAGTDIPFQLAQAASLQCAPPPELVERLVAVADDAVDESRTLDGAFTPEGRWTFRASGQYIKLCLLLAEMSGEKGRCLSWARELADRELCVLAEVGCPEWWRLRERATLLEALLRLSVVARA